MAVRKEVKDVGGVSRVYRVGDGRDGRFAKHRGKSLSIAVQESFLFFRPQRGKVVFGPHFCSNYPDSISLLSRNLFGRPLPIFGDRATGMPPRWGLPPVFSTYIESIFFASHLQN